MWALLAPAILAPALCWSGSAYAEVAPAGAAPALGAEQCGEGETPLFVCRYADKIVSVCGSRAAVTYRFGTSDSTEMTISSNRHDRTAFLSEVRGQGSGGHQTSIRFTRDGYSYIVSAGVSGSLSEKPGSSLDVLSVTQGHKDIASHDCQRVGQDGLSSAHVPEDPIPGSTVGTRFVRHRNLRRDPATATRVVNRMKRWTSCGRNSAATAAALFLALWVALPSVAGAQTLAVPAFDRGEVSRRDAGPKQLGDAGLAGIRAWLAAHGAGWRANLATPPVPEVAVSLGTAAQPSAVTLDLWPTARDADWCGAVVMEDAVARTTWIQTLSAQDAAALLDLVR
jgi:hypothetical protein